MQKLEQLYEGKAKKVFKTDDPALLIVDYKDDATAFNGLKKGSIAGKGVINNQMSNRLMAYLEKQGVEVYYTRESDCELCTESGGSKKAKDLQKRCQIVENVDPDVTISIHQNSYSDAGISGAQVFYYSTSEKSRLLAEQLQEKLISMVDPTNHRAAKANDSYYMLRKTVSPTVIVECGFLSNTEEAEKLMKEVYQEKIAQAICEGVQKFLHTA